MRTTLVCCAALLAVLFAPGRALATPPPNDDFDNATVVTALPFSETIDVSEATRADDDPYSYGFFPTVWYRYTPTANTSIELDTAGSQTQTHACIYVGTRGALGQVACSGDGFSAHIFAELQAGVTYSIDVELMYGPTTLTIALKDRTVANDDFNAATPIDKLPFTRSQDVLRASAAPDDPWCLQSSTNTVWFSYTAPAAQTVEAKTFGSGYDTRICAWTGTRGALTLVDGNDDAGNTWFSDLVVPLQPGITYWFEVATNDPAAADLRFDFDVIGSAEPVANDGFDAATVIGALPYDADQTVAGATGALDDPDCTGLGKRASVWYSVTPQSAGTLDVSTAGSGYNTVLAAYSGPRGALEQRACNDDIDAFTLQSHVAFPAQAGVTYHLLVTAAGQGPLGTLHLAVRLILPPPTLKVAYDPQAVVDESTGEVVLTGTATCSRALRARVTANLGQQLGNSPYRTGSGTVVFACAGKGPTAFTIVVASTSDPGLSDGPAAVKLIATACDGTCAKAVANGPIELVKKLK
jgi:hypothetical protein